MNNLLHEKWIKIVRHDGMSERIVPYQIADQSIVDVVSPRPDFKGALVQFLIGLLQTTSAPEDMDEWKEWWEEPPSPDELKERFEMVAKAFEFDTEGAAFMQDFQLPDAENKPIAALLIETPGDKTLKDNSDHFIKRGAVNAICPHCAAAALFTLQTNAPSGGAGHRTSMRGGGPLSTLVIPDEENISLWKLLWLNILPENDFLDEETRKNPKKSSLENIFPWLAPTRTSEAKTGKDTSPQDAHPYQMYWGMPRRIRLDFSKTKSGKCDLCGEDSEQLLTQYRTKNYGVNYMGAWEHPLSPYTIDPKHEKPPLPKHGQEGGISYRHWLGIVLGDGGKNQPALVTERYITRKSYEIEDASRHARLWAFGYDMDNMKARCWYDSTMPIYFLREDIRENFKNAAHDFINAASDVASTIRSTIKQAWFSRPGDAKGDFSFIDTAFWQNTEQNFYEELKEVIKCLENKRDQTEIRKRWADTLKSKAVSLFDEWAGQVEDVNIKAVIKARQELLKWITIGKPIKTLLTKGKNFDD